MLGFGAIGWVLAAVALALGVVLVTEYDLRHQLLRLIASVLGTDAMFRFVISLHSHAMDFIHIPPELRFGLITMCFIMIAMQVHGRRFGWWAWTLVAVAGIATPVLNEGLYNRMSSFLPPSPGGFDAMHFAKGAFLCAVIGAITSSAMVGISLRSYRLGLLIAVFGIAGAHLDLELSRVVFGEPPLLIDVSSFLGPTGNVRWAWNPLIFVVLLVWAIVARRRWQPAHACAACGYDLRGAAGGVCPECGGARETPGVERG